MNPTDLTAVWLTLTTGLPDSGELSLAPLDVSVDAGAIHAGRDASGRLHLLVPVPPGTPVRVDRRSRGVGIERRELVVGADRRVFIDVVCHEPALNDVFQRLAAEMVATLVERPSDSVIVCQEVLSRWRELLERRRTALGAEAVAGLFGELHVLERILLADPARRVEVWTGPTGARHDFTTEAVSIEVKTSRAREGRHAEIHGVEQLQPVGDEELYLIFIRVEPRPSGRTVGDLVKSLKSLGADGARLDQLLAQVGWESTDDDERLVVVSEHVYPVDETFPRIVPATFATGAVPLGVTKIRYQVDLTGPAPVALDEAAADEVLQRLADHQ